MAYCVVYHNEHAGFKGASDSEIYGPYDTLDAAMARLSRIIVEMDDELFRLDPECDWPYAGFDNEDLIDADRDEDLACEIWAEVIEITAD